MIHPIDHFDYADADADATLLALLFRYFVTVAFAIIADIDVRIFQLPLLTPPLPMPADSLRDITLSSSIDIIIIELRALFDEYDIATFFCHHTLDARIITMPCRLITCRYRHC